MWVIRTLSVIRITVHLNGFIFNIVFLAALNILERVGVILALRSQFGDLTQIQIWALFPYFPDNWQFLKDVDVDICEIRRNHSLILIQIVLIDEEETKSYQRNEEKAGEVRPAEVPEIVDFDRIVGFGDLNINDDANDEQ